MEERQLHAAAPVKAPAPTPPAAVKTRPPLAPEVGRQSEGALNWTGLRWPPANAESRPAPQAFQNADAAASFAPPRRALSSLATDTALRLYDTFLDQALDGMPHSARVVVSARRRQQAPSHQQQGPEGGAEEAMAAVMPVSRDRPRPPAALRGSATPLGPLQPSQPPQQQQRQQRPKPRRHSTVDAAGLSAMAARSTGTGSSPVGPQPASGGTLGASPSGTGSSTGQQRPSRLGSGCDAPSDVEDKDMAYLRLRDKLGGGGVPTAAEAAAADFAAASADLARMRRRLSQLVQETAEMRLQWASQGAGGEEGGAAGGTGATRVRRPARKNVSFIQPDKGSDSDTDGPFPSGGALSSPQLLLRAGSCGLDYPGSGVAAQAAAAAAVTRPGLGPLPAAPGMPSVAPTVCSLPPILTAATRGLSPKQAASCAAAPRRSSLVSSPSSPLALSSLPAQRS